MSLNNLKKIVSYNWKIQGVFGDKAQCVPYLRAGQVMQILDEVVGAENWRDDYKEIKGNLFCGISIKINNEWVTKWNCGVESEFNAEKGESSDSFKRAARKWGIGEFLESIPNVWVNVSKEKKPNGKEVTNPVDNNGKRIYDLTEYIMKLPKTVKPEKPQPKESKPETKPEVKTDWVKLSFDNNEADPTIAVLGCDNDTFEGFLKAYNASNSELELKDNLDKAFKYWSKKDKKAKEVKDFFLDQDF